MVESSRDDPSGAMAEDADGRLTPEERAFLLRLSRDTLEQYVRHATAPELPPNLSARLLEHRGAFVTLRQRRRLRGCVGYPAHRAPLAHTVISNTINAAARDPRFAPVTEDELCAVMIEVSVLARGETPDSPYRRVHDVRDIVIGRDGLFLEHGAGPSGLLLPQVPVEQQWSLEQYLEGICAKAGLAPGAWCSHGAALYRFSAEVFSEETLGV
jgi:AmmeMemoRadiSam system protein A